MISGLKMCSDDTHAVDISKQYLKAFETQATAQAENKRNSLAQANRVLLKTLQKIHRQHKTLTDKQIPQLMKELEEQRARADMAESRIKVLEMHLEHAMAHENRGNMGNY